MARHQHAVIWSRIASTNKTPSKMGDLVLLDETVSFTYTKDYLASGLPGFCLLGDGSIWGSDTVSYPVSERIAVFPRLLSLIPGNNPRNLQRRHYLDLLRSESGKEPPPGIDTEWQLLLLGGHGGIGHVDVFSDDLAAESYYKSHLKAATQTTKASTSDENIQSGRANLRAMLKRDVLDENIDFDPHVVEQTLGPTPSVGGMIPKLLVSIDINELNNKHDVTYYPPESPDKTDVVLKIEPPEYNGLLDLEALCLELHREAGFEVPNWHRYDDDDLHFLAIERFDHSNGEAIPMESLFSVIATGNFNFRETGDILLDELGDVFERLRQVATLQTDTQGRVIEEVLYRRILMALLTGNGDLHLDNISLLGSLNDCRLSPVYDPAPMRAWPRHNLVSAIPFDPSDYKDHGVYFVELGGMFGLKDDKVKECIDDALKATAKYGERVMALERVPMKQRQQLVEIARTERRLLLKHR
jgi:serine/threonine-protein kinase HipA